MIRVSLNSLYRDGVSIANGNEMSSDLIGRWYEIILTNGPIDNYCFCDFDVRDSETDEAIGELKRVGESVYQGHRYSRIKSEEIPDAAFPERLVA